MDLQEPKSPMRDRSIVLGVVFTVGWLLFAAILVVSKWDEARVMSLNSWGDFFAGFFAPLAFLWLVLGFLQQGKELRLSTSALRLQAHELKQSVEQQRELVEATREQARLTMAAVEREVQLQRESAQPRFVFADKGYSKTGGLFRYTVEMTNEGATATNLRWSYDPVVGSPPLTNLSAFARDESRQVVFEFGQNAPSLTISTTYLDAGGRACTQVLAASLEWTTNTVQMTFRHRETIYHED
ncbi:MAG: hypothetical protein Q8M19_17175 [Reyranella sp.]|nr:hypothetical protein [Reyranella sp.]